MEGFDGGLTSLSMIFGKTGISLFLICFSCFCCLPRNAVSTTIQGLLPVMNLEWKNSADGVGMEGHFSAVTTARRHFVNHALSVTLATRCSRKLSMHQTTQNGFASLAIPNLYRGL